MTLIIILPMILLAEDITILKVVAGEYNILNRDDGQVIEMENFGYLSEPGKPRLPAKNFLIGLPPGALVRSVEVINDKAAQLPGTYNILPSPPILPVGRDLQNQKLADKMLNEWKTNRATVYSRDEYYPEIRGKLNDFGSIRKYSYVSVAFYPFSYNPQSGQLLYYNEADIIIKYTLPSPGSSEARLFEELKHDTLADNTVSGLLANYYQVIESYKPASGSIGLKANYDYIIIADASLNNAIAASDFLSWKAVLDYKIKILFTTDPEITTQPGNDLAEEIRNFLRANYVSWGIEYVLFVGNTTDVPMRLCYPDPTNHTYNPTQPFDCGGAVPTDHYYADLSYPDSSSWDSDRDGYYGEYGQDNPDFAAEVYVGRIPTSDSARIVYTLNKLVAFEQDTGPWKNQALQPGAILFFENQNFSGYPFIDGARVCDAIETDFMSGWTVSRYSEQSGIVVSDYAWPALTLASFTDDWRTGQYGIVNWSGHGSAEGVYRTLWTWDDGDGIPESGGPYELQSQPFISITADLEDDYPSIVFAVSCLVGYPEPNIQGNLGIDLLTKPEFGAAAAIVSATRPAAISAEGPAGGGGGAEMMCYQFNHYMLDGPDGPEKIGNAFYNGTFDCHFNTPLNHLYEFQNMFNYNVYGDPSMVRTGLSAPVCGDCDNNDNINIFDITMLINYLYNDGAAPVSMWSADPDGNDQINIFDITYLITYLYLDGPEPTCR